MSHRDEFIDGLLDLAAFLADNPDVPVPDYLSAQVGADGETDDEQCAFVDRAASAMGVEPFHSADGGHYEAALRFGPIRFFVLAITAEYMSDFQERQRLGREALAAKKAAEACSEVEDTCGAFVVDGRVNYYEPGEKPRPATLLSFGSANLARIRLDGFTEWAWAPLRQLVPLRSAEAGESS